MRIIAGTHGGQVLKAPAGQGTRPFLDSVKESLFNIITARVPDAQVLDLFAGSGSLAIEALSRGARSAVLIENSSRALGCIGQNLERTGLSDRARVVKGKLPGVLARLAAEIDLVFVDPPYGAGLVEPTLESLCAGNILLPGALVIVHRPAREEPAGGIENLHLWRERVYGQARLDFYLYGDEEGIEER